MITSRRLIERLGIPEADAKQMVSLIRQATDSGSAEYWRRRYPGRHIITSDEVLQLANHLLDGFGVEPIRCEYGCRVDAYYQEIVLLYVNMGDTYATTLCYDTRMEEFFLGDWGTWLQIHESEMHPQQDEGDEEEEFPRSKKDWRPG